MPIVHSQLVAVVPIFTNIGAAVLPMALAAIGSAVAIIFRPRELLRLCRENPTTVLKSVAVLVGITLCAFVGYHFIAGAGTPHAVAAQPHFDWAKIAENIISQE